MVSKRYEYYIEIVQCRRATRTLGSMYNINGLLIENSLSSNEIKSQCL
jgi:hypothetical protein